MCQKQPHDAVIHIESRESIVCGCGSLIGGSWHVCAYEYKMRCGENVTGGWTVARDGMLLLLSLCIFM